VQGDKTPKQGEKALRRAYDAEDGKSDLTQRFAIRKKAREAGIDVSDW